MFLPPSIDALISGDLQTPRSPELLSNGSISTNFETLKQTNIVEKTTRKKICKGTEVITAEKTLVSINQPNELTVGKWLLVRFATKRTIIHYVGLGEHTGEPTVKFLCRKTASSVPTFVWCTPDDISEVECKDVVMVLPEPNMGH
ncbi:hypothetical protein PR048_002067 [Dryococelus australis]|uniref:Uncharacterized protein n=1 Tax=Dryococelus australis TaxID=614101 RepID=A0ABQ9IJW8_9NEOP|nr:hypothetical protein PR048_002067 [Dryococelus australis]